MTPGSPENESRKRRGKKRPVAVAVAGLVAVSGGLLYVYCCVWRPIGGGPAGPAVPREPFESVWTERPVLLLGIGDSITAGFGAPPSHSCMGRLVSNPDDEFPAMQGICLSVVLPNLTVRNVAVSGSTSIRHLEFQIRSLAVQDPETLGLVVMTTGGNDLIHMYGSARPREGAMYGATLDQARPWIENFEKRLDTMVGHLEALFPGGCHIFLANIYDPSDGVGDPGAARLPPWPDALEILAAYNAAIGRCAERFEFVHLVNIHDAFLGHGVHCTQFWRKHYRLKDPHYWYFDNLEDPNDRGYDAIRRLFLLKMAEVAETFRDRF